MIRARFLVFALRFLAASCFAGEVYLYSIRTWASKKALAFQLDAIRRCR